MTEALTAEERALFRPMPRRARIGRAWEPMQLPEGVHAEIPPPDTIVVVRRMLAWATAGARVGFTLLKDELGGVRDNNNRGRRLRELFEMMGGTAIKLGQQLSARVDLLPFEVCGELGKLMDKVPPFPASYAIQRLEAVTGKRVEDIFVELDTKPIGAASVACVWQARLHSGERVAIKVRRPDVADKFACDLRAFDGYTHLAEILGLVRPGFFRNLRVELRMMFMEELDFNAEARYQSLFRQWVRDNDFTQFDAPRVYRELCADDVIVTAFAEGVPATEVVNAVETKDPVALAALTELNIDPVEVADNLAWLTWAGRSEGMFFHSDPHPGNIIIMPGDKVIMLDFGACGTMTRRNAASVDRSTVKMNLKDFYESTQASIALLMPLPQVDFKQFHHEAETGFYHFVKASSDPKAPWYERTTASLWITFLGSVRSHNIPVNLDTLRTIRASLLYDTLVFRLDEHLKLTRFNDYWKERDGRVAKATAKRWQRGGLPARRDDAMARVERALELINTASLQLDARAGSSALVRTLAAVNKWAYGVRRAVTGVLALAVLSLGVASSGWALERLLGDPGQSLSVHLLATFDTPLYAAATLLVFALLLIPVVQRLDDAD